VHIDPPLGPGGRTGAAGAGFSIAPNALNSRAAGAGRRDGRTQLMLVFRIVLALPPGTQGNAGSAPRASGPRIWFAAPASLAEARFGPAAWMASRAGAMAAQAAKQPSVTAKIVSRGASTGKAFDIEIVNGGADAVDGAALGIVVEPLDRGSAARVVEEFGALARGRPAAASAADGYCVEFERDPPAAGTVFRVAPPEVQQRFQPMRRILEAARALEERGALNPDSDPVDYYHAIRQWALWTRERGFDAARFTDAFVERTKKNFAEMRERWTREVVSVVRGLAPNRWQDIQRVLGAAGR
jgi:hypothetical protein